MPVKTKVEVRMKMSPLHVGRLYMAHEKSKGEIRDLKFFLREIADLPDVDSDMACILAQKALGSDNRRTGDGCEIIRVKVELSLERAKLGRAATLIGKLRDELEGSWLLNHDERCTNMEDCSSFKKDGRECHVPRPDILEEEC